MVYFAAFPGSMEPQWVAQRHISERTLLWRVPTTNWGNMSDEVFIDPPALKKIGCYLDDGGDSCKATIDSTYYLSSEGMFGARRADTASAFVAWFHEENQKSVDLATQSCVHGQHLCSDADLFAEQDYQISTTLQRQGGF